MVLLVMIRRPPRSTRTYTLFPYTTIFRYSNDPWFTNEAGGHVDYRDPEVTDFSGHPFLTGGTMTGVQPVVRNDNNTRSDKLWSAGWNTSLDLEDRKSTRLNSSH